MRDPLAPDLAGAGRARRWIETCGFVAAWMGLGLALRLEPNGYLLLGIPLTLAFQYFVRRAPVMELWVRDGPPFHPGAGLAVSLALVVLPVYLLVHAVRGGAPPSVAGILIAAMMGSVAVAYALQHFRWATARALATCVATAGGAAIVLMLLGVAGARAHRPLAQSLEIGVRSFLLYLPIVFLLEEVSFRGALDSHVHRPGEGRGIASAIALSALWGLWHLPIATPGTPLATAGQLLLLHVPVGFFLSLSWRRSGNLLVPGTAHAFMDAVRNAVLATIT
jgi:membrane protease YdiL (CAAX protease family)